MTTNNIIKTTAAICFALMATATIIAWDSPATGYEASIYAATPLSVWVLLILSIICGIAIIVHQLYTKQNETSKLWAIGLLIVLFSSTVILSLHIIRGYALWNGAGDSGMHLGTVNRIISEGHITRRNLYPIPTILTAQLSQICDLPPSLFILRLPIIFALLYYAFVYILAKSVMPKKGAACMAVIAALIPIHGIFTGFFPYILANLAFPMVLFFLIKSLDNEAWQWKTLFIITIFLLPVFHPLIAAILAIFLTTLPIARLFIHKLAKIDRKIIDSSVIFSTIALVILVGWMAIRTFSLPVGQRSYVAQSIIAEQYSTPLPSVSPQESGQQDTGQKDTGQQNTGKEDTQPKDDEPVITTPGDEASRQRLPHFLRIIHDILYAQRYGYSAINHFFKLFGDLLLYIILSLIAFITLCKTIRKRKNTRNLFSLCGPLATIVLAMIIFYATALPFNPMRLIFYVALLCTFLGGFILFEFIECLSTHQRLASQIAAGGIATLLILTSINGIARFYPSPYTLTPSYHTTQTEIDGIDWFLNHRDANPPVAVMSVSAFSFANFLFASDEETAMQYTHQYTQKEHQVLRHFGYDKKPLLGQSYKANEYLLISSRDRVLYTEVWPEIAQLRFLADDFMKLKTDNSLYKLYQNSGMDIYYINAIN